VPKKIMAWIPVESSSNCGTGEKITTPRKPFKNVMMLQFFRFIFKKGFFSLPLKLLHKIAGFTNPQIPLAFPTPSSPTF